MHEPKPERIVSARGEATGAARMGGRGPRGSAGRWPCRVCPSRVFRSPVRSQLALYRGRRDLANRLPLQMAGGRERGGTDPEMRSRQRGLSTAPNPGARGEIERLSRPKDDRANQVRYWKAGDPGAPSAACWNPAGSCRRAYRRGQESPAFRGIGPAPCGADPHRERTREASCGLILGRPSVTTYSTPLSGSSP